VVSRKALEMRETALFVQYAVQGVMGVYILGTVMRGKERMRYVAVSY
jgi:hypothetical protein